ncbi:MAG: hypothetical protein VB877_00445 [Pirellulaceae bacterium]
MHSLITELADRFWRRPAEHKLQDSQSIAQQAQGIQPNSSLPAQQTLCAFNDERLVNYYRDRAPDSKPGGENWWLIPRDDLPVTLTLQIDQELMEVDILVRLEAESELMDLLGDRKVLTMDDLTPLLAEELTSLADIPDEADAERLIDLGKLDRERLRARYSLRLQKKGLRCTDISRFELLLPAADSVRLSVADLPTEKTDEGELHPLLARQQLQEQLDEANRYVRRFINRLLLVYIVGCVTIFAATLASKTTIDALAYVMAFLVAMFFVRLVISPTARFNESYIKDLKQLARQAGISFHRLQTLVARDYKDLDRAIEWDR